VELGLVGKRALVLSSSRGLGRAVAESLAAEGASVVMTARNSDRRSNGGHHSASRARIIVGLSGFFTLSQSREGPDR
jgi:NAD(P)-dependent dehydrogenase (short-subunit alcohol dehydrogenase family)